MTKATHRAATPFTLCADDYGLAPGVSRGIRELIDAGVLTATGCMTVSASWPDEAAGLRILENKADIGLHFTLTDHRPLGAMPDLAPDGRFPPLPTLLKRSVLRRLDKDEIKEELGRQITAFSDQFGRLPDFVDGHHHVHQLPVVRDALFETVARTFHGRPLWLRSCYEPIEETLRRGVAVQRASIITQLGRPLERRARKLHIKTNHGFRGVYDFRGEYAALFPRFIGRPRRAMLVMCHPGYSDPILASLDPVTASREAELAYFLSPRFNAALHQAGVIPARLSQL